MSLLKQLSGLCPECAAETILQLGNVAPDNTGTAWCPHHQVGLLVVADADNPQTFLAFPAKSREHAVSAGTKLLESLALAAMARLVDLEGAIARLEAVSAPGGAPRIQ